MQKKYTNTIIVRQKISYFVKLFSGVVHGACFAHNSSHNTDHNFEIASETDANKLEFQIKKKFWTNIIENLPKFTQKIKKIYIRKKLFLNSEISR